MIGHGRRKVLNIGGRGARSRILGSQGGPTFFAGCKVIGDRSTKNRIERYTFTNTFK